MLTLGSLFDGLGGWQIAAQRAGIKPLWSSEIEPYCVRLTKERFPETEQLGDITRIDGGAIPPVDIVCAGSPCQDLSVAGYRKGLEGERSGLFVHSIRIVREMRRATNGRYPRFFVWENVPGAFSTNGGNDFRAVLKEIGQESVPMPSDGWAKAGMAQFKGCEIAWRVLDAQFWGVPQRRKRIFLVADFAEAGRRAGFVLFKPESLRGDTLEGGAERGGASGEAGKGAERDDRACFRMPNYDHVSEGSVGSTLKAEGGRYHGGSETVVLEGTYRFDSYSKISENDIGSALKATGGNYDGGSENLVSCRNERSKIFDRHGEADVAGTLTSNLGGARPNDINARIAVGGAVVRRLTPIECERLQGLPDNWTLIEGARDSQRYKAIGNGMAQPCADFVMEGIVREVELNEHKSKG